MAEADSTSRERRARVRETAALMVRAAEAQAMLGSAPWLTLELTIVQLKVLLLLGAVGTARPGEISRDIGITSASVTGVLDRLERQGYVVREPDPDDRRALSVRLTAAGGARLRALYSAGEAELAAGLSALAADDLAALQQGMDALVDSLRDLVAERAQLAHASA